MEMNGDEYFKTGRTATDKTATVRTATGKTAMGKTTKGKLKGQPRNNNKFFLLWSCCYLRVACNTFGFHTRVSQLHFFLYR
jgi:hypothetical protein